MHLKAYLFSASFLILIKPFLNKPSLVIAKNILVVQTDNLGDIVLALTFLNNLGIIEKECAKYLLVDEKYDEGLFTNQFDYKLLPLNKNKYRFNLFYRISFLNKLRKLTLKSSFNISPGRGVINDELTINSNSQLKSCLSPKSYYLPQYLLKKYNSHYNVILESDSKNEFIRLEELFCITYKQNFIVNVSAHNILRSLKPNLTLEKKYIIIAPSASETNRNWSQNNFRTLCGKLSKKYSVYLLGTQSQVEYLTVISEGLINVQNLAGKLQLAECIYLIQNAVLFVGLDSGFTHISHTFKKPFVAIIGGGKFGRFFPYPETKIDKYKYYELPCFNCNWQCIYHEAYCVSLVSVEDVYNSCVNMIVND
ncbi:MAG: hypothetical protein MUP85_08460 [Candidatus Lokiarchaeota archaeon]|nr:hypothetical protein [Candidatus Lokiarchaeota archaeon]